MKKLYFLALACIMTISMSAQDATVLVVSEILPGEDANIQGIMDAIDGIEGVTAEHMERTDYNAVEDFTQWNAVFLTENGSSSDMTTVQDAGWEVPVVSLKAYALYKGDNPLFTQEEGVNWVAATKGEANANPENGATTVIVDDNSNILCNYEEGDEVEWSTAFDEGQEAEAHWQTFDLNSSEDVQISESATAVGLNKAASEDAAVSVDQFLWTVEANETTERIVAWGVHHYYLAAATDDFYQIVTNSVEWALSMEIGACASSTSVEDIRAGGFEMYPNPVQNVLTISNAEYVANVEIVDLTGKVVASQDNSFSNVMKLNTSDLNQGMYIVNITTTDGKNFTDKLIK